MLYIRIKHNFWAIQPVFHSYNIHYWLKIPFIIHPNYVGKKYLNFKNTEYYSLESLVQSPKICDSFIKHIQSHYLREKNVSYIPDKNHVLSHFKHGNSVFVFYYLDLLLVGCITSRFVNSYVNGVYHRTSYVDYLCVHSDYRKKGIAPELIETNNYYKSKNHKDIDVYLFKKENTSHWIINLVSYNTYFYEIDRWDLTNYKNTVVREDTIIAKVTQENAGLWIDFLKLQRENMRRTKRTKCFIQSDDDILISQMNQGIYFIYLLLQIGTNIPVACYLFKDSGTEYKLSNGNHTIGLEVQSCFKIDECDDYTFIDGFYHALYNVQQINTNKSKSSKEKKDNTPKYQMILFENISDNNIIRNNFLFNRKLCCGKMPSTFYFYNYASRPVKPEEVVVIL